MADPIAGVAAYLQPGMKIKIRAPRTTRDSFGWFADDYIPDGFFDGLQNASTSLTRGFAVENDKVGTIAPATDDEGASVVYTHKVGDENGIWFFSVTGEMGLVRIIAVPIHDHGSIVQGGPAYGTYFDDDEEATT
jgi:hypothetical protein